jgi:hypothetical protein
MENTAQCWAMVRPKIEAQWCGGLPCVVAKNGNWASASRPGPGPMWPGRPAHSAQHGHTCDVVTALTVGAVTQLVAARR